MATETETVTVASPFKAFGFFCGIVALFLMVMSVASTDWLISHEFRHGLWEKCIGENAHIPSPMASAGEVKTGCVKAMAPGYVKVSAALCIIAILCDLAALGLTAYGVGSLDPVQKQKIYRLAIYTLVCSLGSMVTALIVYPACFSNEVDEEDRQGWEFGWAYSIGWGAAIFIFGDILLLLCDRNTQEVYYREKEVDEEEGGGAEEEEKNSKA